MSAPLNIHVDIETFSSEDLKKAGTYRYSLKSEVQLFSWRVENEPVQQLRLGSGCTIPDELKECILRGQGRVPFQILLWAHNAEFEWCILNSQAGQAIGFPPTTISQWRCTAALAHSLALPGKLEKLAEVLRLPPDLQKSQGMKYINTFGKVHDTLPCQEEYDFNRQCLNLCGFPIKKTDEIRRWINRRFKSAGIPRKFHFKTLDYNSIERLIFDHAGANFPRDERVDKVYNLLLKYWTWLENPNRIKTPKTRIYPEDEPTLFNEYAQYNVQDVVVESKVHEVLGRHMLSPGEQRVWQETVLMNQRGIPIDLNTIKQSKIVVEKFTQEIGEIAKKICELSLTQTAKLKDWCNDRITSPQYKLPNLQEKTLRDWLTEAEYLCDEVGIESLFAGLYESFQKVMPIIRLKLDFSSAAVKKLDAAINSEVNDCIQGCYGYHGPTTGRWAGYNFQPQNLFKALKEVGDVEAIIWCINNLNYLQFKEFYPNVLKAISSALRSMIMAPTGYSVIVSDYNAIEFRVLCWLAGEIEALKDLRDYDTGVTQLSVYEKLAAQLYDIPESQVTSQHKPLGKQGILGCGYQIGPPTFKKTCAKYNIMIPLELAQKTVSTFRNKYRRIVQFWYDLENKVKQVITLGAKSRPVFLKSLTIWLDYGFLFIQLPSGRKLSYPEPRIENKKVFIRDEAGEQLFDDFGEPRFRWTKSITFLGKHETKSFWSRKDTYGGKLTENVVQAIAADIMRIGFLNLVDSGKYYPFGLSHDEAMSLVLSSLADQQEYNELLCKMEPWASDIPLQADGFIAKRYRKD